MTRFSVISFGSEEYKQMLDLRHRILRAPLNLFATEEELAKDKDYTLLGLFNESNNKLLACCFLTHKNNDMVQLRQMAVDDTLQNSGYGRKLIEYAEQTARNSNYKIMYLHARETAVGFYEKLGYTTQGEYFYEIGVPHIEMIKNLQ